MPNNNIRFRIGFDVDRKELESLQNELKSIQNISKKQFLDLKVDQSGLKDVNKTIMEINYSARTVSDALSKAFNQKLNTINIQTFNQYLKDADLTLDEVYQSFSQLGSTGQNAFRNLTNQILMSNTQMEKTETVLDRMAQTLSNTLKWNIASSAINMLSGEVQQAYGYVNSLDRSLNDIRIVTGQSAEEMQNFAEQANDAALALGQQTTEYTNASLIYAQQGLPQEEIEARARVTLMAANVTGQDAQNVSEQLTAVWNGFNVTAQETELYVDRLAVAAAATAADLEELSIGMSRVASAASTMGVTEEQLASQLATIISVTREAPESVGTALRSIYTRMSDIESGLDDETSLGYYTGQMAQFGVEVLDANGEMRDLGEVIEEVGGKWSDYSREQQIALAQIMGGTYQFNDLLALFDNWDDYVSTLGLVQDAEGELQKQQDIYMESTAAHLNQLDAQWEDLFDSFLDPNTINDFADGLRTVVDLATNFVDALGGGEEVLLAFGAIAGRVFKEQLSGNINASISNIQTLFQNIRNQREQTNLANQLKTEGGYDSITKELAKLQAQYLQYKNIMTEGQRTELEASIKNRQAILEKGQAWDEAKNHLLDYYNTKVVGTGSEGIITDTITADDLRGMDESQILEMQEQLEATQGLYEDLSNQMTNYRKTFTQTSTAMKNHLMDTDQLNAAYGRVYTSVQKIVNTADEYLQGLNKESIEYQNLNKVLTQFEAERAKINSSSNYGSGREGEGIIKTQSAYKALITLVDTLGNSYQENSVKAQQMTQITMQLLAEMEGFGNRVRQTSSVLSTLVQPQTIEGLVELGDSALSVFSIFSSIKNLGNIWSDETLSDTEKMTQSFMSFVNIGTQGVIVISQWASLAPKLSALKAAITGALGFGMGPVAGVLLGLAGIVTAVTAIGDAAKKAREESLNAFTDSLDAIEQNETAIQDLNTQLDENNKKIEEIKSQGLLSITDEQDIDNLERQNSLLETQIELEKLKLEAANAAAASAYENNENAREDDYQDTASQTVQVSEAEQYATLAGLSDLNAPNLYNIRADDRQGFNEWQSYYLDLIAQYREEALKASSDAERESAEAIAENIEYAMQRDIAAWETLNNNTIEKAADYAQQALDYLSLGDEYTTTEGIEKAQENMRRYYEVAGVYQEKVSAGMREAINENSAAWDDLVNKIQNTPIELNNINEDNVNSIFGEDIGQAIQQEADQLGLSIQDFLAPLANSDGLINLQNIKDLIAQTGEEAKEASTKLHDYQETIDLISDISSQITSGGYDSLSKTQQKALTELESQYEELGIIQDKNSHDYLEALRYIQEQLEDNHRTELENVKNEAQERAKAAASELKNLQQRKKVLEGLNDSASAEELDYINIEIITNTNELQDAINDILSADYELKVKVNAEDLKTDVSQAFDFATELQNIGSYFTDTLKVSIEEANEIVDSGMGAMLINAKATTDGMIQLNAESVNAFINGKQSETEASRQAYIAQLEQSLTYLETQRNCLQKELEYVEAALNAEGEADAKYNLMRAQNMQNAYQHQVDLLTQQLSAEDDYRYQSEVISSQLNEFKTQAQSNALLNLQKDESDATTQQAQEINRRIDNLEKYYNSLVSVGEAVKQALSGTGVSVEFNSSNAVGGGGTIDSGDIELDNPLTANQTRDYALNADFDVDAFLEGWNEQTKSWSEEQKTQLEDLSKELTSTISSLDTQIGALTGGIEALKAADYGVDYLQDGGGSDKKGSSTGSAKELDLYNDRLDVFSAINEEIDNYEASLSALQEAEESAYGPAYSKNLNDQLEIIDKLKAAQEERLRIAQDQEAQLANELTAAGFTFTDAGALDRTRLTELKNVYDEAALRYNAMTAEQQKAEGGLSLEEDLSNQKETIESLEQLINLWEKAQSEGNDATKEIAGYEAQIYEIWNKLRPGEQLTIWSGFVDILNELGDATDLVNDKLDILADEQDHLAGNNWFENVNDQIDTLNLKKLTTLVDAFKDLGSSFGEIADIKNNFKDVTNQLKNLARYNDELSNFDINIDPDKIDASAEGIQYVTSTLKDLFAAYNSMESGQQGTDVAGLIANIAGSLSGNILSIISLIVQVIGIIRNVLNAFHEIQERIIELNIEKFNKPIEVALDLQGLQEQWNDFRRTVIDDLEDDDWVGQMKQSLREIQQYYNGLDFSIDSDFDFSNLNTNGGILDTLSGNISILMAEIRTMLSGEKSDIYGDHLQDALDDLDTYAEELENSLINVAELEDEIHKAYINGWEDIKDSLQEQVDEYDRITNEIEHNQNLISMLYGDDAYAEMGKFYDLEEKANSGRLQYLTQTVHYWEEVRKKMEAAGETEGEAWEKVVQAQKDAQEDLNQALENAVQTIIDNYQNAIAKIFDDMTKQLTDGMGLDYIQDQWDLINQRADKYLDDINAAYAIQSLQSKVQDALNDNDGDLKAQQQIRDVMDEQLIYLQEKENLTQYDVDRAEKLLDIELKRLALQNAQQNRSTMRLRRDANGNYSYQFVADEDAIAEGQQELADAQNDLYNFDKDEYNSNLNDIYNLYQDYNSRVAEIASDNTLTEEQRQRYLAMLNEEYQQQMNALVAQNEQIRNNLTESAFAEYSDLYDMQLEDFVNMTEEQKDAFMSNLVETWDSGLQQMADAIAGEGGFQVIAEEALAAIKEAQDAYNESIEQTKEDIDNLDFTDFQAALDNILNTTTTTIGANDLIIEQYEDLADQLIETNQQAQAYLQTIEQQNQAYIEQLSLVHQLQMEAATTPQEEESDSPFWFDALTSFIVPGVAIGNLFTGGGVSQAIWDWGKDLLGFSSGGYTGDSLNNDGGLAVLHEKELVLNEDDTRNILNAVNSVRDIANNQLGAASSMIQDRMNGISKLNGYTPVTANSAARELTQNVTIQAEFPDATDRNEIRAAFDNLINVASQKIMIDDD